MKIAFNPSTVAALTSPPDNKDITFDLAGRSIFVRGVKFFGTDTQVNIIDNLNSSDSKSALSANMGRYLNLTKTPYNNTSTPSSAPSAYNIEICPSSSGWYSSLGIPDGGGGLLIRGNTGTAFNLWLHDTSNVWYKQTASGDWKKMDAGNADTVGGYSETNFFRYRGNIDVNYIDLTTYTTNATGYQNPLNGVYKVSRTNDSEMFISFSGSGSTSGLELYTKYSASSPIKFRHRIDSNRIDGAWRTLIDSSSIESQTVASASKLTTARSIWGQSFDGSKDISGDMRNVGTLYFSNTTEAHIGYNNTYTDPYVNLSVNFKLGGTVAAKTIYSNGGFVKSGSSNDYVLLGGGSHSKISSLSVGNADTVDGYHATDGRTFTSNINWGSWSDLWSDGTNNHPWYGFDHRYPNTGVYSTTLSDYFGMTLKTANTLQFAVGSSYFQFGDSVLKLYSNGSGSTERVYLQANIDSRTDNYTISSYGGEQRHSIILNPRGGYVGIGVNDPLHKLHVGGDAAFENTIYLPSTGSSYIANGGNDSSGADFNSANIVIRSWWGISFKSNDDVIRTYLDTRTGNLGTKGVIYATHFYEYSDRTLKKNIKSIKSITNIPKLREFNWKDTGKRSYGFIAQELEDQGYACLVNEVNGKKTVNYTAALTLTMAKLQNLINVQNKKISNLTKELKSLKYGRKKNS